MAKKIIFLVSRIIIKIIFIDKLIFKNLRKHDLGIIDINKNYIVDIPKSGSSSIKHFAALKSKRFNFLTKNLKFSPKHSSVLPVRSLINIKHNKNIVLFVKAPEERLYSIYKEKVLFNKLPINYSIINRNVFWPINLDFKTSFNKNNTFLEFCEGIIRLNNFLKKEIIYKNYLDKHIITQYDHVLNLREKYPNIIDFKFIIYPISKLNEMLSSYSGKKVKKKFNSTINNNFCYLNDIQKTSIINNVYEKDKIIYERLISSKKDFIELNFDSFLDI